MEKVWLDIPKYYTGIFLDEYVVMPNHFHGIIGIEEGAFSRQTGKEVGLGDVIGAYKNISLKRAKRCVGGVADSTE
jgi:hypothetical protein